MNEKDLREFEFAGETTVTVGERLKSQDVYAICLESDDEELLVPMKIYKIGRREEDKARVIDEAGEVAIYPLSFFLPLSLAEDAINLIEKHNLKEVSLS